MANMFPCAILTWKLPLSTYLCNRNSSTSLVMARLCTSPRAYGVKVHCRKVFSHPPRSQGSHQGVYLYKVSMKLHLVSLGFPQDSLLSG